MGYKAKKPAQNYRAIITTQKFVTSADYAFSTTHGLAST